MDAFKVHQLAIAGRHYILLPKLNSAQMEALAKRLTQSGFLVSRSNLISAKSVKGVIHVDPRGFCWSSFDPRDEILPAIPNLLETPKEREPLRELMGLYFMSAKSKAKTVVKVSTRVESSTLWKALRASGECGLTPDEHAVVSFLFKKAKGECRLLTDYPTEGSTLRIYGRRRYYESELRPPDAGSTLRTVGRRAFRNSYVPRNGALMFESLDLPSKEELAHLFEGLGEWCYFHPT
ncbi:MAG: hypothetical protein OK436_00855 [Thaumarchaeota archaeon]|nr:hypothetical protein [Nitrososphaerota archaeon]